MSQVIKLSALNDGVIDPRLLKELNIDADTQLEVKVEGGALVLRPVEASFDREVDASAERMMDVHQEMLRNLAK